MNESEKVDHNPAGELVENEAALERSVAARTGRERFRTRIQTRQHTLEVDEPEKLGGTDAGPTPFDLLSAALASCTTITLRMYADRKEWPLEEVGARVEHSRIDVDKVDEPVDQFIVTLELTGKLSARQRTRLGEIAARCPVHRTLMANSTILTRGV